LLREILKRTDKVGIARVVIRTRQYLAALMPHEDALVLVLMRFPQEIVAADEFKLPTGQPAKYRVSAKELEMGEQLIASMATKWNPGDYHDEFRGKLRKLIDAQIAKQSGGKSTNTDVEMPAAPTASNVVDFTALLKKSLAAQSTPGSKKNVAAKRQKAG